MAKRLTDTGKYRKRFIRNLPGPYKLLWDFLYHECDHAGIWYVDFEIAQICLGKDMIVTSKEALRLFNSDEERIVILNNGTKWLIKPFIEFQYGVLNPINRVHQSVINILKKEGVNKTLTRPLQRAIDIAIDKDKDKDKDSKHFEKSFNEAWSLYPNKVGRKEALRHFIASVKTDDDLKNIKIAIENYKQSDRVKKGYIQNGSTFFNDWQGWVTQTPKPVDPLAKWEVKK